MLCIQNKMTTEETHPFHFYERSNRKNIEKWKVLLHLHLSMIATTNDDLPLPIESTQEPQW